MKKYKYYLLSLIMILLIILGLMISCSTKTNYKNSSEPPEISVKSNNIDIQYVVGKNIWNGSIYDRLDNFQAIMNDNSVEDLIYIPIGEEIEVDFKGYIPDTVEVVDEVVDNLGNVIFNNSTKSISMKLKDGKGSFIIEEHPAILLSSNSKAFDDGVLRGIRVTCKWDDNECEYAFIIKTNKK